MEQATDEAAKPKGIYQSANLNLELFYEKYFNIMMRAKSMIMRKSWRVGIC